MSDVDRWVELLDAHNQWRQPHGEHLTWTCSCGTHLADTGVGIAFIHRDHVAAVIAERAEADLAFTKEAFGQVEGNRNYWQERATWLEADLADAQKQIEFYITLANEAQGRYVNEKRRHAELRAGVEAFVRRETNLADLRALLSDTTTGGEPT